MQPADLSLLIRRDGDQVPTDVELVGSLVTGTAYWSDVPFLIGAIHFLNVRPYQIVVTASISAADVFRLTGLSFPVFKPGRISGGSREAARPWNVFYSCHATN